MSMYISYDIYDDIYIMHEKTLWHLNFSQYLSPTFFFILKIFTKYNFNKSVLKIDSLENSHSLIIIIKIHGCRNGFF